MKKTLALMLLLFAVLVPAQALAYGPGDDIVMFGQDVFVGPDEMAGDVVIFGGTADIQGSTTSDVVVIGGSATVTGKVGGDLIVVGGSSRLLDSAEIMGDVITVGGRIDRQGNPIIHGSTKSGPWHWSGWYRDINFIPFRPRYNDGGLWSVAWIVFLGWLIYSLLPKHVSTTAEALQADPAKATVFGLLGYIAFVPLVIVLAITLVGIPLIPVLALALIAARVLGQVALGVLAGKWLSPKLNLQTTPVTSLLLGLVALGLLTIIPVVGFLASMFYGLVGFGAVLRTRFGTRPLSL